MNVPTWAMFLYLIMKEMLSARMWIIEKAVLCVCGANVFSTHWELTNYIYAYVFTLGLAKDQAYFTMLLITPPFSGTKPIYRRLGPFRFIHLADTFIQAMWNPIQAQSRRESSEIEPRRWKRYKTQIFTNCPQTCAGQLEEKNPKKKPSKRVL